MQVRKSKEKDLGNNGNSDYEPITEIKIHIGEKSPIADSSPIRVYINGKKIERLRGFKFDSHINKAPVMTIEKYP